MSIAKVADGIYIGNLEAAKNNQLLTNNNIHCIVNLSNVQYNHTLPQFKVFIDDIFIPHDQLNIFMFKFKKAVSAITRARESGYNVFIHCMAGVNRSATAIALYLIEQKWNRIDVLNALYSANKERNVECLTNPSFRFIINNYAKKYQ
jgi:protein-tyrosine phosphatase